MGDFLTLSNFSPVNIHPEWVSPRITANMRSSGPIAVYKAQITAAIPVIIILIIIHIIICSGIAGAGRSP